MTITRRTTGPASYLDRSEETRLAERQRLRVEIATREIKIRRMKELQQEVSAIDRAADAAADKHAATCEPIQRELSDICREQAVDLATNKKENAKLETRRRELLDDLAAANEILEAAIAKSKGAKKYVLPELAALTLEIADGAALESQLQRTAPLADQAAAWAGKRALRFASERLAAAQQNHRSAAHELRVAQDDPNRYDLIQFVRRELEWGAEVSSAQRMLDAAKLEHDAAQRKLMADETTGAA